MTQIKHFLTIFLTLLVIDSLVLAVETNYFTVSTEKGLKLGELENVLVSSAGNLSLGYDSKTLLEGDDDVWVVNDLIKDSAGNLYVASSGQGLLYKIASDGKSKVIYNLAGEKRGHLFSLALTKHGDLLCGSGGDAGLLVKIMKDEEAKTIFSDKSVKYIWDIIVADDGNIIIATGPEGKILELDQDGALQHTLLTAKEKNILSLAMNDKGELFAGGDKYGLIYKIDRKTQKHTIVYESGKGEISALKFDTDGNLYATTADGSSSKPGAKLLLSNGSTDKVDLEDKDNETSDNKDLSDVTSDKSVDQVIVKTANKNGDNTSKDDQSVSDKKSDSVPQEVISPETGDDNNKNKESDEAQDEEEDEMASRPRVSSRGNKVYQITPLGFVNTLFSKRIVILDSEFVSGEIDGTISGSLLLATGHDGNLIRLDIARQEGVVLHQADPSYQISSVEVGNDGTIYLGCANPGRVVVIKKQYAALGKYESEIIDTDQISSWGKLQVKSVMPGGTSLKISTRTGNTKDPENGGWEDWTEATDVVEDFSIKSMAGRFIQYALTMTTDVSGENTPVVSSVKLAYQMPNIAPRLTDVKIKLGKSHGSNDQWPGTVTKMSISYRIKDINNDAWTTEIAIRQVGNKGWIIIAKDVNKSLYTWPSHTVADGRYEAKVTASDHLTNSAGAALTSSRISESFVVDHHSPVVVEIATKLENDGKTVQVDAKIEDLFTVIGGVYYAVDSSDEWQMVLSTDGVYDSRYETVSFSITPETSGKHLISFRVHDARGNAVYKNITIETR
jgi:hypothetical protein